MHVCNYTPLNCSSIDFRSIIQSTNFDGRDSLFTNICQGFSCYGNSSCFHVSRCNVTCAAVIDNINRPKWSNVLLSFYRERKSDEPQCLWWQYIIWRLVIIHGIIFAANSLWWNKPLSILCIAKWNQCDQFDSSHPHAANQSPHYGKPMGKNMFACITFHFHYVQPKLNRNVD